MKIVMIHPHDLFSLKEPWTIRIKAIAQELKKLGHQITIITFTLDSFKQNSFYMEGIKYYCFPRKSSPLSFLKTINQFRKIFIDYDLVYFQKCFHFASVPSVIASFLSRKWTHYDWDDDETAIFFSGKKTSSYLIGFCIYLLEKLLPSVVNSISVSSDSLFKKTLSLGINIKDVVKIPVGSYTNKASEKQTKHIQEKYNLIYPTFIYVGQLHGGQYVENLLLEVKKLKQEQLNFKLLIVGDGHDKVRLESISNEYNLGNEVIFSGYIPHNEVFSYIQACDVAIACFDQNKVTKSKSPLKIAEYLSSKIPIIASNVGEVPFMLNNQGILIDPNSNNSLFHAMKDLIKKPEKIKELSTTIQNSPFQLTWKNSAKKLDQFITKKVKTNQHKI